MLALVGIVSGFAWLSLNPDGGDGRLAAEAERLAAVIEQQRFQATLRGELRGLRFGPRGYTALRFSPPPGDGWAGLERRWRLPDGVRLRLTVEGLAASLTPDGEPQLRLSADGEVSEFSARFSAAGVAQAVTLSGDPLGRLTVVQRPADGRE